MFRFPWGDMHSLNLGWFLQKFNELREDWATAEAGIDGALDAEIQKAEDALSDVFDARDAAAASATAAAGSATAAGTSATAAQNSATAAASSATLANNKATAAGLSEAAAAQSAQQAGNSATAAGNSATAAGQSATNAAASETAAGQSATAAAGSATAAEASATAAEASAQRAEDVEESIPEDYSDLSADVAKLKTDTTVTTGNLLDFGLIGGTWFQGIVSNPGAPYACYTNKQLVALDKKFIYLAFDASRYRNQFPSYTTGNITVFYYNSEDSLISSNTASISFEGPLVYQIPNDTATIAFQISSTTYANTITPEDLNSNNPFAYVGYSAVLPKDILDSTASDKEYGIQQRDIIKAMIAKELPEMIADTNLSLNDFRIVGNLLFRITTTVSTGSTLIPGTNCLQTTLGDFLKMIS